MKVEITLAPLEEKFILRNLLELCQHDYSEFTNKSIGDHGLFDYPYLDHYWTDPDRYPFLIRVERKLAGFVFVQKIPETDSYTMAEFFVLRKYRHQGLGQLVAHQVFDMFPGHWKVRQDIENTAAQAFWRKVVTRYTQNRFHETQN
ncbi:GNAT family N-acetyltransferase [Dictyobacter arantiisoli]|uniref:Acetyltransferase n=1 Tax=Dictyobacter arantiisoli TaxID=2014874 RepID=A0A5A5TEC3_9CHLR|nr:GNAT family N-acetyltransferase [Dictyobacter arantiisoli]GCF09433.1 acetyltransferase [Dictyobacter arantiisoli]